MRSVFCLNLLCSLLVSESVLVSRLSISPSLRLSPSVLGLEAQLSPAVVSHLLPLYSQVLVGLVVCLNAIRAVSYTHLTLPTIYSV